MSRAVEVNGATITLVDPWSKTCTKCGVEKVMGEFPAQKKMNDGRCSWCRECHNAARRAKYHSDHSWRREVLNNSRAWAAANPERRNATERVGSRTRYWRDPDKYRAIGLVKAKRYGTKPRPLEERRAHWAVKQAVRSGKVVKPKTCSRCFESGRRIEAHHPNHSQPLVFEWLCSRCHGATRRKEHTTP